MGRSSHKMWILLDYAPVLHTYKKHRLTYQTTVLSYSGFVCNSSFFYSYFMVIFVFQCAMAIVLPHWKELPSWARAMFVSFVQWIREVKLYCDSICRISFIQRCWLNIKYRWVFELLSGELDTQKTTPYFMWHCRDMPRLIGTDSCFTIPRRWSFMFWKI